MCYFQSFNADSPDDAIQTELLLPHELYAGNVIHSSTAERQLSQQQPLPPIHSTLRSRCHDMLNNTGSDLVDSFGSIYQSIDSNLQGNH